MKVGFVDETGGGRIIDAVLDAVQIVSWRVEK